MSLKNNIRFMRKVFLSFFLSGSILIVSTGCSDESIEKVSNISDELTASVKEIKDSIGQNVETLDQVNTNLVQVSKDLIMLLEEFKFDISFKENGISFKNDKGITGMLGINGNTVFLELTTDQKDAETVETIIRIANIFSNNNTVEDRIEAFVGQEGEQRIELNNGYLETDGKVIKLYLETYPF